MLLFFAACTINYEEHTALIDQLRAEGNESQESTHYIYYGANDSCLTFDRSDLPYLSGDSWGFSFRMATMPDPNKYLSMLQTPEHKIFLNKQSEETILYVCTDVFDSDLDTIQDLCHDYHISNEELLLAEGDRLTIIYNDTPKIHVFQNKEQIKSFDTVHLHLSNYEAMSFGCTPITNRLPWYGGIDALILFSEAPLEENIKQLIDEESENRLGSALSNSSKVDSYWNLGEDIYPNVLDEINGHSGTVTNIDFVEYAAASE